MKKGGINDNNKNDIIVVETNDYDIKKMVYLSTTPLFKEYISNVFIFYFPYLFKK